MPAELRARIAADVLTPLQALLPDVRWVQEETLHVTLLFLGEHTQAEAEEAKVVVREVAATHEPFTASLGGLGVFPGPALPQVVWLGLNSALILDLHRALGRERDRLGTPPGHRAFSPHITLGRLSPRAKTPMSDALGSVLAGARFTAPVAFGSLDLMQSKLTPEGPRYTPLLTASLGTTY